MPNLDSSQLEFCESTAHNIRLLAPAGCGKTSSLLHRCKKLVERESGSPRFLIITFTNAAAEELKDRQAHDSEFEGLKDRTTVTTLNSYGWRRIRAAVRNAQLLTSQTQRHFAVINQLRPTWRDRPQIEKAITRPGRNSRTVLDVMDNLKSMGFDHTVDITFDRFQERIRSLELQGASWRIDQQFEELARLGILDSLSPVEGKRGSGQLRSFYSGFFTFWREATTRLLDESTFTFEDQKYWPYLDLRSPGPDGKAKPHVFGAARHDHVLVDEFQDINPLDLALIGVIVDRHQSTLTIVGDDDQAIFEWRGATPEYILQPQLYFGAPFADYQLETNYRSPRNIVDHSQKLISHNRNRVDKRVNASPNSGMAKIEVLSIDDISQRLRFVTDVVRDTEHPGRVAVIGHRRGHLIPYEIYYASDGAPFKTAADLDIFSARAFEDFTELLDIWNSSNDRVRSGVAVNQALKICNLIKRWPLNKKDAPNLKNYLLRENPRSTYESVGAIASYVGDPLSGKSHTELHKTAKGFLDAVRLPTAIELIDSEFAGLRFDYDKQEESIWHTAPPLLQLAKIAEAEGYDALELIERIDYAKQQIQEYSSVEDVTREGGVSRAWERPLHLMTAWRAKGKEFDTVILLDTVDGIWPDHRVEEERELEAERRVFYVAFTRAQRRVIMLTSTGAAISPFVTELELPS